MKQKISITLDDKILKDIDNAIDNIIIRNRSQAIEHLVKNALGEKRPAVILAGGDPEKLKIGSEYSITAKIKNSSVIEQSVKKLRENGFRDIWIVARAPVLTAIFEKVKDGSAMNVNLHYIEEKRSNGSADSLKYLRGKIKSTFLVVYADIIYSKVNLEELWLQHLRERPLCTLMLTTSPSPQGKGVVKMEGSKVLEFQQRPVRSDDHLVFSPIFVVEPELLEMPGKSLEYDIFPELAAKSILKGHISSEKESHIHNVTDLKKIVNL